MTEAWITRTLGEICDEVGGVIRTGPFGSQLHQSDYHDEGIAVVMPVNIIDGKVSIEGIAFISEDDAERLAQHKLCVGDIVYGRRGDIGRQALITEREQGWLCGTGCLRIGLGNSVLEPIFLHYFLDNPQVIQWIFNQAIGATLPNLNTAIIRSIQITYPPLEIQRKIAAILSTYDDLIENNTRRIKLLEQAAHDLYREWFVEFRFPGHEQVPLVESALGLIPQGWEVERLATVAKVNARSIKRNHEPEQIQYADIASVSTGQINEIKSMLYQDAPSRARRIVQHGDILWSTVRPNLKAYSLIVNPLPNLVVSTGFAVITAEEIPYTYLYSTLTTDEFVGYLVNHARGAAYPAVSSEDFENAVILCPSQYLVGEFHRITAEFYDEREILIRKNKNLRLTRDLLLPRLVSGEVDVSELEIEVAE